MTREEAITKYIVPAIEKTWNDKRCKEILEALEQEPKTGHWIYKQYGGYPEQGDYHCSECDSIDNRIPAYCPNCGAKMFDPQESEG